MSETFLEVLARTEPQLFFKASKKRKKELRQEAGRRVQEKVDELKGRPALFIKFVNENPELVREYNDSVIDDGEDLEDDGEVFKSGESPDAIYDVVVAKARALRSSEPTLTIEKAVSRVLDAEPRLYGRYVRALG